MSRIHSLAIFMLVALFGCHLCQSTVDSQLADAATKNSTNTTTTLAPITTTKPPQTTTTTPAPTTTTLKPTPTPTPGPQLISGNITDETNHTCVRYEFTVHFTIKYNDTNNATKEAVISLPLDSKLRYDPKICNSLKESFELFTPNDTIVFNLTFGSNDNSVFLDSIHLNVTYDNKSFPGIETKLLNTVREYSLTALNSFNVEKTHSYFCANVTIPKGGDAEVEVTFESLKLQAFMEKTQNGQFSSEHNCQNEINDVVPIAVGAALTGLVVIVMIAYFIGRRRSRRLAYQSV